MMETEVLELVDCDGCGVTFSLQEVTFFAGPGESWWCNCPSCGRLTDPLSAWCTLRVPSPAPEVDRFA